MEILSTLSSIEITSALGMVLVGAIVSLITQLAKKFGMKASLALTLVCIAAGILYSVVKTFVDPATLQEILLFVATAWGFANMLYNAVKIFVPSEK